jgi:hypothetical protein
MHFRLSENLSQRPIDRDANLRCLVYVRKRIEQSNGTIEQ